MNASERLQLSVDTERTQTTLASERWRLIAATEQEQRRPVRILTVTDAAAVVRGRRVDLGLSQAALAAQAGVSRKWIYEFEAGKPTVELGLMLRVFEALGLRLSSSAATSTGSPGSGGIDLDAVLDRHRAVDA